MYKKNVTLKELAGLDFVGFYEMESAANNKAYLLLFDCNNIFYGITKEYNLERLTKFIEKQGLAKR